MMSKKSADNLPAEKAKIVSETARMPWRELQRWFASGAAIYVAEELDLIEVAWQLSCDNKEALQGWMAAGQVAPVSDQQALSWLESDEVLWASVVKPLVLVQPVSTRQ
jgi:hypothetical protein